MIEPSSPVTASDPDSTRPVALAASRIRRRSSWSATTPAGSNESAIPSVYAATGSPASSAEPGNFQSITEQALRLTEEEARDLSGELNGVLREWVERNQGRDASRRTYLFLSMLQPLPERGSVATD